MLKDFEEFCKEFNIIDNALDMRTLVRWNGRNLRNKENLAEHTHLVVACAIELYEKFRNNVGNERLNFENIIKYCMLHDSLELLRGDILSITKDIIPGLRKSIDDEEYTFLTKRIGVMNDISKDLVTLSDLMACYKFIEKELCYPGNDFTADAYKSTKEKYDIAYKKFCEKYIYVNGLPEEKEPVIEDKFVKGYFDDAGTDIILDKDATFMPMSSTSFDLNVNITPEQLTMGVLLARTSAAHKGLIVSMCPIDPNYTGNVMAIVHNISNNIIEYKKGESFCQFVILPFVNNEDVNVKRAGKRSSGRLGSTGV